MTADSATPPCLLHDGGNKRDGKPKKFYCFECSKVFRGQDLLYAHEMKTGHNAPKCMVCKQTFTGWVDLRKHESHGHDQHGNPLPILDVALDDKALPLQTQPGEKTTTELPTQNIATHQASSKDPKTNPRRRPILINTMEGLHELQNILEAEDTLAFDLEAICCQHPRHHGALSLLQFGLPNYEVYLVDVLILGCDAIQTHLGDPVLGNPNIVKLMYDCRIDAEALSTQANITPRGVVDLQVYVAYHRLNSWWLGNNEPGRRVGLFSALKHYLHLKDAKKVGSVTRRMRDGEKVWDERPLTQALLEYASGDVMHMYDLFKVLERRNRALMAPTIQLSAMYVSLFATGHLVSIKEDPHFINTEWMEECLHGPNLQDGIASECDLPSKLPLQSVTRSKHWHPFDADEENHAEDQKDEELR
mmetsp:Transcript_75716/g.133820  ORF Transcript_75716/g.133820 Transcript_75716/m.133820 type:complete len:418 (-) Transcript_75716:124-1377(-)